MAHLKVLLIDDHRQARQALTQRLGKETDLLVRSTPASAPELISRQLQWSPDVILIDVKTTLTDGADLCREVNLARPGSTILVLTSFLSQQEVDLFRAAGAAGVFVKDLDVSELIGVIRSSGISKHADSDNA